MKRRLIPLIAAVMLCGCSNEQAAVQTNDVPETVTELIVSEESRPSVSAKKLACNFYDGKDHDRFERECPEYEVTGEICCGTVPHHLLAGKMISGFFRAASGSREKTDTVVIIATMHEPRGIPLVTSDSFWQTPFGVMETDTEMTELFRKELGAENDDLMLETDHSASAVMPFAKYYFPDAKAACLLVSGSGNEDIPERLSELLGKCSEDKELLIVFSMDFSHYLAPDETKARDAETLEAVMASDYRRISEMTNDNVDSARCLETFTRFADSYCSEKLMLDRSDSLIMSAQPYSEAVHGGGLTSYFVFAGIEDKG